MEWKLYNVEYELLQYVNCQYDACDIATLVYDAIRVELDFENKIARIIE